MALLPFASLPLGVPALLNPPSLSTVANVGNLATLVTADATIVRQLLNAKPRWGIFLKGKLIAEADNVLSVEYRQDSRVSQYPQEQGAFQSYNKVATPFEARVQLTKGGSEFDRSAFLKAIESAARSLDLYDVATPERTYSNANIERFDYRRTAHNGAGLITVEIWLVEVRETAKTAFTKTALASGADPKTVGAVQAQTVTPAQASVILQDIPRPTGRFKAP